MSTLRDAAGDPVGASRVQRTARHRATGIRRGRRRMPGLTALALGVPTGLLACGAMVWGASYAAFSAQTSNAANAWATGSVVLRDDDGSGTDGTGTGVAMFTPTDLRPGSTGTNCLTVTYSGTLAAAVRLHATRSGSTTLADNLDLVVRQGAPGTSGAGFGSCTGFDPATATTVFSGTLSQLATNHPGYATGAGAGAWSPSGAESRVYQVTWTLRTDAPNTTQASTAGATFTWEARST